MNDNLNNNEIYSGIGDWGLGIGDWGLGPIPNPQYKKYYFLNLIYNKIKKKINLKNKFSIIFLLNNI